MATYNWEFAATYGRVSTADQQNSIRMQQRRIEEYAAYRQLRLDPTLAFVDEDTSGTVEIAKRDGGRQLMQRLATGSVKHLIVLKLDRLGRNALDIQTVWRRLTDMGVVIHVLDLGGSDFSSDNPMARFVVGLLSLLAELEVERIRSRIVDVFDDKFAAHEVIGPVPYGFRAVGTGRFNTKRKPPVEIMGLVEDPEEQKWWKQIIDWSVGVGTPNGLRWHPKQITAELNRLGVPTRNGGKPYRRVHKDGTVKEGLSSNQWNRGTIFRILEGRHAQAKLGRPAEERNGSASAHADPAATRPSGDPQRVTPHGQDGEREPGFGGALCAKEGHDPDPHRQEGV